MYRFAALAFVSVLLSMLVSGLPACFDLDQGPMLGPRPEILSITMVPEKVQLEPNFDPPPEASKEDIDQLKRENQGGPCCAFNINFDYALVPDQFVETVQVTFDGLGTAERFVLEFESRSARKKDGSASASVQTRVPPQIAARGRFTFRIELVTGAGVHSKPVSGTMTVE